MAPLFLLVIEETRHSVILKRLAKQGVDAGSDAHASSSKFWSTLSEWKLSIVRPFQMLLTEPVVFCMVSTPEILALSALLPRPQMSFYTQVLTPRLSTGWKSRSLARLMSMSCVYT